jgi:hypothetical protein
MAKKNLHTKRGLALNNEQAKFNNPRRRLSVPTDHSEFYSKPDLGFYSKDYNSFEAQSYSQEFIPQHDNTTYTNQFIDIATASDIFDPFANPVMMDADLRTSSNGADQYFSGDPLSSTNTEDFDSKLPPLFGSSQPSSRGFSSVLFNSDTLLSKSLGSMAINDYQDSFTSRSSSFSYSPPIHPGADQNPPCNTLYVGNLPNDSCEDELRQLFQCCPGYKRLSFKTRANGPMCFVEVFVFLIC